MISVDGSGAGSGNLEILVNGGHVTSFVRNLGSQRFLASFVPHEALSHTVEMKFNGESVPGKRIMYMSNNIYVFLTLVLKSKFKNYQEGCVEEFIKAWNFNL